MSRKRAAPSIADMSSVSREPVSAGGVQESCLVAAAELFPRRLVFILLPFANKIRSGPTSHHETIAGFSNPLFGGLAVPGGISTF